MRRNYEYIGRTLKAAIWAVFLTFFFAGAVVFVGEPKFCAGHRVPEPQAGRTVAYNSSKRVLFFVTQEEADILNYARYAIYASFVGMIVVGILIEKKRRSALPSQK